MPNFVSDGGEWKRVVINKPKPEPVEPPEEVTVVDQGVEVPAISKLIVEPVVIKPKRGRKPKK